MISTIDTTFKMYSDTPDGKDPDTYSRTLCDYHLFLWSKQLPSGTMLNLSAKQSSPFYLHHSSDVGDFWLSSDSILHTYSKWTNGSMAGIVNSLPEADIDAFYDLASTIGGYIIFPAKQIDRKPTINQIRGTHPRIRDRFDFTLECIRRWYSDIESPLSLHFDRYGSYFRLFEDFQGFWRFFLLDDLVDANSGDIRFWLPFEEFGDTNPLPANAAEYQVYMKNVSAFATARNSRIADWAKLMSASTDERS